MPEDRRGRNVLACLPFRLAIMKKKPRFCYLLRYMVFVPEPIAEWWPLYLKQDNLLRLFLWSRAGAAP